IGGKSMKRFGLFTVVLGGFFCVICALCASPVGAQEAKIDRGDEAALEYFAIERYMNTDQEAERAWYYQWAKTNTGYNGSFQFMTEPVPEPVAEQALNIASTILPTDRDPLDVVLRRTRSLLDYLVENFDLPEGALVDEQAQLDELDRLAAEVPPEDNAKRRELFARVIPLRRKISLQNPLLDFDDILFIKRHPCRPLETTGNHMCDQFFGFHALAGGGLFVLKDAFTDHPEAIDLLADLTVQSGRNAGQRLNADWGYLSPELSYDTGEILFAAADTRSDRHSYQWTPENSFHLFRVKYDAAARSASDLTQLTDGPFDDFDPCLLPSGRIAFISSRRGGYGRCHPRIVPSYTLHSVNHDGSDIVALSNHETNEWQPDVDSNGMIIYTRWDYVDRGANNAHHPWITSPDGRDPRAILGNYNTTAFNRPVFEGDLHQVPGSGNFTSTITAHHGQSYGSLALIDPRVEDDNGMGPVRRITPDQLFPESELMQNYAPAQYATCHPLSDYFYLCVYDPYGRDDVEPSENNYGIYLLDAFGNRTLLYRDSDISCRDPIPIRKREVPPIVPHKTLVGKPLAPGETFIAPDPETLPKKAIMSVVNVYDSMFPVPEGTKIKKLRVVQLIAKTTWEADHPKIGYGMQKNARQVLGTVPVEEDGSARFYVPVNIPIYFQALDENDVAVESMRSDTYVHEGEELVCQGCHENRHTTTIQVPHQQNYTAMRRAPSELTPDYPGTKPMNFPVLIQTILDEKCVDCHAKSDDPKAIDLSRGPEDKHFFNSYENLRPYCFFYDHYLWTEASTKPGEFGAMASPLYKIITGDHHGLELTKEELARFADWLDNNADFYGLFENCPEHKEGQLLEPTLE
ncbi:MAG: hypothetical protein IJG83_00915, partial [Thermoguttaceae bacterium]|nr:hypothetical protein [Thermoguttaceae bacterium]